MCRPGGACSTFGIELTTIEAVATSPWMPPTIFDERPGRILSLPANNKISLLINEVGKAIANQGMIVDNEYGAFSGHSVG